MGDVVFSLGDHDVGAVVVDDAHVFDPRAGENRVFGVAGPVNAVARGGQAQRHGRRAVAGVAGVPETVGSIVADQDVASFADLAVPGVAPGAGEDRVFRDRSPGGQRPGGTGPAATTGRARLAASGAVRITTSEARPSASQDERCVHESSAGSSRMRWPGVVCDR